MKHKRVKKYRMDIKSKGQCVKLIEMIPFFKYILDIGHFAILLLLRAQ